VKLVILSCLFFRVESRKRQPNGKTGFPKSFAKQKFLGKGRASVKAKLLPLAATSENRFALTRANGA